MLTVRFSNVTSYDNRTFIGSYRVTYNLFEVKLLAGKMVETVLKPQSPQHLVNRQLKTKQNKLFIVFHSAENLKSRAKYKAYELQNYHFF